MITVRDAAIQKKLVYMLLSAAIVAAGCSGGEERTFTIPVHGGQFSAWGVTLTAPPGVVSSPVEVTVTRLAASVAGVVPGTAHALAPVTTVFARPVTLTLWLAPENLTPGAAAGDLSLVKKSGAGWQPLAGGYTVDAARHISAQVTTLGSFAGWDARAGGPADAGLDRAVEAGADAGADGASDGGEDGRPGDLAPPSEAGLDGLAADAGPDHSRADTDAGAALDLPPHADAAADTTPGADLPRDLPAQLDTAPAVDAAQADSAATDAVSVDLPPSPDR